MRRDCSEGRRPVRRGPCCARLGVVQLRLSRHDSAAANLRRALTLFREVGDLSGQARVMTNLGTLTRYQGNYDTAVNWHAQAVAVFRRAGDALGEGGALNNLGVVERHLGRYRAGTRPPRCPAVVAGRWLAMERL